MTHGTTEKSRIIVSFGDITGFTHFYDSVTNEEKELDPFMQDFVNLIDTVERKTGYSFTIPGDGFMCTVGLGGGHSCNRAIEVLTNLWGLLKDMEALIQRKDPPRPQGFRVRVACGYVNKRSKKNGGSLLWGKHINLAHNLLDVSKDIPFICHDSVKQLLSDDQIRHHNFRFSKIAIHTPVPDVISPYDSNSLWSFEIKPKKKNE